jgi:hypothetical protein
MVKFGRQTFISKMGASLDADAAASAACGATTCTTHIGCLLRRLPMTSTIYTMTPAELALADGPLWNLLGSLFTSSVGEAGTTSVSKTLARKRPALLPILDGVALTRIGSAGGPGPNAGGNWAFLRDEITASAVVRPGLAAVRSGATVPDHYQDLRLIDIVVWMRQYPAGRHLVDQGSCQAL